MNLIRLRNDGMLDPVREMERLQNEIDRFFDFGGPTSGLGQTLQVGLDSASDIRSSVGVGLIWDSPLGPLRFDLAYPLKKYCSDLGGTHVCDRTQIFRFSGGTKF